MPTQTEINEALMARDFAPESGPDHQRRRTLAEEYSAYQLGRIRKSLEDIAESLATIAEKP